MERSIFSLRALGSIGADVQQSLKKCQIKTRPGAGPGIWLSFLLPLSLLVGFIKFPDSTPLFQQTCLISVGLLLASTIDIIIRLNSKGISRSIQSISLIVPTIFTIFLLNQYNYGEIYFSILWAFCSVFLYSSSLKKILLYCPYIFTFGEASVVTQALILFVISTSSNIQHTLLITPQQCFDTSTTILQIGLLGITLICGIIYCISQLRSPAYFYAVCAVVLVGFVVPMLHILIDQSPVLWILQLLVANISRVGMIAYWGACSVVAVFAVTSQISNKKKASTVIRKYFHILAVAVFLPGLIQEGYLLYLASGIVFALFIVLELLRVLRMPPLGNALQDGFSVFADEKDQGALALTPIYLLAGCSLPIWLHPTASPKHLLPLLSGVLSVGIGDTAASVFGTWLGKHRWPGGTKKTIEGTLGCIFSQMFAVALLVYLGYLEGTSNVVMKSVISIIVTSIVEAKTDQVDNLALPLIMYVLLL